MSAARRGRRGTGLVSALVVLGFGLAPLLASGPSYAAIRTDPSPTASASNDDAPAQVLVSGLEPRAPMSTEGFFRVTGTIVNRGSQPLHELTVRLRRGSVLSSRSQLQGADQDQPATPDRVGRTPVRTAVQDLAPGNTTTFDLRIRVAELRLGAIGVYPLKVEARAQFGDGGSVSPVGNVLTYIPWFPDGPPHGRIRVAWLWPLVDQPRRGPREVMLDDELATSFRKGGRLDRLLRAAVNGQQGGCDPIPLGPPTVAPQPRTTPCRGDSVPITYAVDPDLLFTADALTKPYLRTAGGNKTVRVDDTAPATDWLDTLRSAVAGADVMSLPYADPDIVALTNPATGLADEVPLLRELGKQEATRVLHKAPMTSVVWPPAGRLTRRAVEALTSGGATAVAIDPTALPAPESEPFPTPGTAVGQLPTNTGQPTLLTIEPTLSALLSPDLPDYPGDRIVEQRWLAETAMISAEEPSVSRTILVAPPRRADLHAPVAAEAIKDTGRLPWLCPVSLSAVAAGSETCADEAPRTQTVELPPVELEPPHAGDDVLSTSFLTQVRALRRDASQFTDEVLAEPTSQEAVRTTGRLTRARARTESSAWRSDVVDGERMRQLLHDDLADLRGKVRLQVGSGVVTLTSSTGVISVNVVNELDQPVRVGVHLDPRNQARLSTRATPITLLGPSRATQINLKVTAQTSGKFPVFAQLVDHDGNPFGARVSLVVRSTQYGRVALAVTGIGAGVLLAAAGVRIVRRALRRPPA